MNNAINQDKLIIFDWDNTIIRTHMQYLTHTMTSIKNLDGFEFMTTYFGDNDEDIRLFLTVVNTISKKGYKIGIASFADKSLIMAVINKYFSLFGFHKLIDIFNDQSVQTEVYNGHNNKNPLIMNLMSYYKTSPNNVIFIDDDETNIKSADKLGIITYHINNKHRSVKGIAYDDFIKLNLLPIRHLDIKLKNKLTLDTPQSIGYSTYITGLIGHETDPISLEPLHNMKNDKAHPFGVYFLKSDNSHDKAIYTPYETLELYKWIVENGTNPLTRQPLDQCVIDRIKFHSDIIIQTPNLTYENVKSEFDKFMESLFNGQYKYDPMYHVIVNIDSMTLLYEKLFGPQLSPRVSANKLLEEKPVGTWIVRKSTLRGDDITYSFTISWKSQSDINHSAFILKLGYGIGNVPNVESGDVVSAMNIQYQYKTLFQLLEVYGLEKCLYYGYNNSHN